MSRRRISADLNDQPQVVDFADIKSRIPTGQVQNN